jgi:hypothetical protein
MNAFKVETVIQSDGVLHLTELPCRAGDRVEAIILVLETNGKPTPSDAAAEEKKREEALRRFQARADASRFRSTGPYPSRDELHERH